MFARQGPHRNSSLRGPIGSANLGVACEAVRYPNTAYAGKSGQGGVLITPRIDHWNTRTSHAQVRMHTRASV